MKCSNLAFDTLAYITHCKCLQSMTVKVALAAIGVFALSFAFSYPMYNSEHIALIVCGSISLALAILGFARYRQPKQPPPPQLFDSNMDADPELTPEAATTPVDYTNTVASAYPSRRHPFMERPTPMRPLIFSPEESVDMVVKGAYDSLDPPANGAWRPIEDM